MSKTRTLSSALAAAGLIAFGGVALAGSDGHEAYKRAFPGEPAGSASLIEPMSGGGTGDAHAPYNRAFLGASPGAAAAEPVTGRAAFGTPDEGIDGNAAYHGAFYGD